jgi:4-hydroxy-L-threonine phosphate dehydrogenase PdxA
MKPIAIISEGYDWNADPAVSERLVFFGNTASQLFEKDGDTTHATFKLRSILTGDGTYAAAVRHPVTKELIYEAPMKFVGQSAAMSFLLEFFLVGFELKEVEFPEVPNKPGEAEWRRG